MVLYEANKKIQEYENKLRYLNELREMAFISTQPKAVVVNDMSVQGSHKNNKYERLDYSIDEIEPEIKTIKEKLKPLKNYVKGCYEILERYEPTERKIFLLREEKHMKWDKISEACHYSRRTCIYKYKKFKEGIKDL